MIGEQVHQSALEKDPWLLVVHQVEGWVQDEVEVVDREDPDLARLAVRAQLLEVFP